MKKRNWMPLCACLLVLLALCDAASAEESFYSEMPPFLRVTQATEEEKIAKNVYIRRTYPDTASETVDAQMRALIDQLAQENRAHLPEEKTDEESFLDVGAVITRSGTSWMSFLALAEASRERELLHMDFETRVYDMQTGKPVELTDVFDAQSEAWDLIRQEAEAQLREAFPQMEPDEERLAQLLDEQTLKQTPFTVGAARLTLTFRADAVYPGTKTLLHVHLYYNTFRELMTKTAFEQTDNSRFRMVALTYDDGGARKYTRKVLDELRKAGAQATFFIVGRNISRNHDILSRQQNSAYSIQTHTYRHRYTEELNREEAFEEKEEFYQEIIGVTGVAPTMMRAPGGDEDFYIRHQIGYPLMHWSLASGDSGNTHDDQIARRVIRNVDDGDVVLLHDINGLCWKYSRNILRDLNNRGFLCVTMEELFADAGVKLEENKVYYSPCRIGE